MSKNFCRIFLLVALLLPTAKGYCEEPHDTVDLPLKTAMAMAIHNNLDLRVDALTSSISDASLQQSRGIYDPYLSLSVGHDESFYTGENYGTKSNSANFGITQNLSTGGSLTAFTSVSHTTPLSDPRYDWSDWYSSVGVTLNQPLLKNFGKDVTELSISLARNDHAASIEEYRDSITATVYDVIKSYNRLYTLQLVLKSRKKALTSAQKLLKTLAQSKKKEQQSIDLANTKYSISRRLKDLVDAEKNLRDQEAKLRYLIGIEKRIKLNPIDLPSTAEPLESTEQALSLAMENGFNLKQLRLDLQSSELQERTSKRNLLPDLALNASVGFRGIEDRFSDSAEQIGDGKGRWWSAGLKLSVPLGNSIAESAYQRNSLRTQQIRNRIAASEWKLRDRIETDMRALISARIQRQVAAKSLELSRKRLEQYRQSVARKKSNIQDLLNAENDLIYAKIAEAEAVETFANAVALLWRDAGVLLERKDIHVNPLQPTELTVGLQGFSPPPPPRDIDLSEKTFGESPDNMAAESQTEDTAPITGEGETLAQPAGQNAATKKIEVTQDEYTLNIGEYFPEELARTRKKVRKAGLVPRVTPGAKQTREVIRLHAGDYATYAAAKQELGKLEDVKARGFIVRRGKSGYRLYAGSFFSHGRAQKELRRLAAAGLELTLEKVAVQLPTSLLLAGHFSSREAALTGAEELAGKGIEASVQRINE